MTMGHEDSLFGFLGCTTVQRIRTTNDPYSVTQEAQDIQPCLAGLCRCTKTSTLILQFYKDAGQE